MIPVNFSQQYYELGGAVSPFGPRSRKLGLRSQQVVLIHLAVSGRPVSSGSNHKP